MLLCISYYGQVRNVTLLSPPPLLCWNLVSGPVPRVSPKPSAPPNISTLSLVNTKVMAASIKPGGCGDW